MSGFSALSRALCAIVHAEHDHGVPEARTVPHDGVEEDHGPDSKSCQFVPA